MDYKTFLKETKNNPEDWDICVAIEYKNHELADLQNCSRTVE